MGRSLMEREGSCRGDVGRGNGRSREWEKKCWLWEECVRKYSTEREREGKTGKEKKSKGRYRLYYRYMSTGRGTTVRGYRVGRWEDRIGDGRIGVGDGRIGFDDGKIRWDDGRIGLDDRRKRFDDGRVSLDDGKIGLNDGRIRLDERRKVHPLWNYRIHIQSPSI